VLPMFCGLSSMITTRAGGGGGGGALPQYAAHTIFRSNKLRLFGSSWYHGVRIGLSDIAERFARPGDLNGARGPQGKWLSAGALCLDTTPHQRYFYCGNW